MKMEMDTAQSVEQCCMESETDKSCMKHMRFNVATRKHSKAAYIYYDLNDCMH